MAGSLVVHNPGRPQRPLQSGLLAETGMKVFFTGDKISAREVERRRRLLQGAPAKAQELAARRRLSGLGFGRLIGLVLRLEDDAFVEFRKGELDLDLRQGENRVRRP